MTLRQYWDQLQPRERRVLLLGAIALVLLLLYALVWSPFQQTLSRLDSSIVEQRNTLGWMQQAAQEARSLRGTHAPVSDGRSLLAVTDETARAHGLGTAVKRVQPDGQHTVRVWLEGARFDDILQWLATLTGKHGVKVTSFGAERSTADGQVHARLVLESAQ